MENKKIIGVLPVGGNAIRLGLPSSLSKPMLPQARQDRYIPVICHTIEKMKAAGATEIYLIHGTEGYKEDIVEWFNEHEYHHLLQRKPNFANTLLNSIDFYYDGKEDGQTRILFGLPDTVFEGNPYLDLVNETGIAVALFDAEDSLKVDRVLRQDGRHVFDVKSVKTSYNTKWFWGCFALDSTDLSVMIKDNEIYRDSEIGAILSRYQKSIWYYGKYLDLGIWDNMNRYWIDGL